MATKSLSGFMVEEPSITEQTDGNAQSPMGLTGGNADQRKMGGTPAQQAGAAQVRKDRLAAQQQTQPAPETLEQQQRYTTPDQIAQIENPAQSLANLGPIKTQVNALVESKMQAVTAQDVDLSQLSVAESQIGTLPPEDQQSARDALGLYQDLLQRQKANDPNDVVTDEMLENAFMGFSDIVGQEQVTDMSVWFDTPEDILGGMVNMSDITIGELDFADTGTDIAGLSELLGTDISTMNLDQFDAAIDAYEAKNLQQVEMLEAQLADPMLPESQRQQIMDKLSELYQSGVAGIEAGVDQLEMQIDAANTLEIGGIQMSIADALGDDGISQTIKNALSDPKYLDDLSKIPGTEGFSQWIQDNKGALTTLVGEFQTEATDFIGTQKDYDTLKTSLGPDGADLVAQLSGVDITGESISSADLKTIQTTLAGNKTYQFLTQAQELDPDLVNLAKHKDGFIDDLTTKADAGFSYDQITSSLEFEERLESGEFSNIEIPGVTDGKIVTTDDLTLAQEFVGKYDNLSDDVQSFYKTHSGYLTIDEAVMIGQQADPESVMQDVTTFKQEHTSFLEDAETWSSDPKSFLEHVFGHSAINAQDLNWALDNKELPNADMIKSIFDTDGDGEITQDELTSEKSMQRYTQEMGFADESGDLAIDDIISMGGDWELSEKPAFSVGENAYGVGTIDKLRTEKTSRHGVLLEEQGKQQAVYESDAQELGISPDQVEPYIKNADNIKQMTNFWKQYELAKKYADGLQTVETTDPMAQETQSAKLLDAIDIADKFKAKFHDVVAQIEPDFPGFDVTTLMGKFDEAKVQTMSDAYGAYNNATNNLGALNDTWATIESTDFSGGYENVDWDLAKNQTEHTSDAIQFTQGESFQEPQVTTPTDETTDDTDTTVPTNTEEIANKFKDFKHPGQTLTPGETTTKSADESASLSNLIGKAMEKGGIEIPETTTDLSATDAALESVSHILDPAKKKRKSRLKSRKKKPQVPKGFKG
jgi:hypothetical protein